MLNRIAIAVALIGTMLVSAAPMAQADVPLPCVWRTSTGVDVECVLVDYWVGVGASVSGGGSGAIVPAAGAGVCYPVTTSTDQCINPQAFAVLYPAAPSGMALAGVCWYPQPCDFAWAAVNYAGAQVTIDSSTYGIHETIFVPFVLQK